MIRAALLAPVLTFIVVIPAWAAEPPPERVINLIVYGEDSCPEGKGDDIVVCARQPESERYRIPKPLRERPKPEGGPGWASQVAEMEKAGQMLLPDSCSPVGSNGFTGCTAAMIRQWYAEKRMDEAAGKP